MLSYFMVIEIAVVVIINEITKIFAYKNKQRLTVFVQI